LAAIAEDQYYKSREKRRFLSWQTRNLGMLIVGAAALGEDGKSLMDFAQSLSLETPEEEYALQHQQEPEDSIKVGSYEKLSGMFGNTAPPDIVLDPSKWADLPDGPSPTN
jgi:hypothetical protein